jgi:hypothetical protein
LAIDGVGNIARLGNWCGQTAQLWTGYLIQLKSITLQTIERMVFALGKSLKVELA